MMLAPTTSGVVGLLLGEDELPQVREGAGAEGAKGRVQRPAREPRAEPPREAPEALGVEQPLRRSRVEGPRQAPLVARAALAERTAAAAMAQAQRQRASSAERPPAGSALQLSEWLASPTIARGLALAQVHGHHVATM